MMGQKIAGGMKRQRLSPLLPVEQAVAMRHYQMIDRYIACLLYTSPSPRD